MIPFNNHTFLLDPIYCKEGILQALFIYMAHLLCVCLKPKRYTLGAPSCSLNLKM